MTVTCWWDIKHTHLLSMSDAALVNCGKYSCLWNHHYLCARICVYNTFWYCAVIWWNSLFVAQFARFCGHINK